MEQGYAKIEKGINLKGSRCMLNIYYGDMQESVYNTAAYFKYDYEDSWIIDPFVKEMIQDVDHFFYKTIFNPFIFIYIIKIRRCIFHVFDIGIVPYF